MYSTASKLSLSIIKRTSGKRVRLVEKDTGLLQLWFLSVKKAVPNPNDSLVSSGFKFFKAGNDFSPSFAQWDSNLDGGLIMFT